jgi:hypothetical protein
MKAPSKTPRTKLLAVLGVCACCCSALHADGLPEPGLVRYGTVVNTFGGANARLTSGWLIWTLQPAAGGGANTLITNLENSNGQLSHRVATDARRLDSAGDCRLPVADLPSRLRYPWQSEMISTTI